MLYEFPVNVIGCSSKDNWECLILSWLSEKNSLSPPPFTVIFFLKWSFSWSMWDVMNPNTVVKLENNLGFLNVYCTFISIANVFSSNIYFQILWISENTECLMCITSSIWLAISPKIGKKVRFLYVQVNKTFFFILTSL